MAQIARLHSSDIANGNLIDATHLNNEFNQLVNESNGQDTRLTSAESSLSAQLANFKYFFSGLIVEYNNPTKAIIKPGICRDSTNTENLEVSANLTIDLAASGVNGLDTGAKTNNTWYYLWLIKNVSNGTVAGLFSVSSTNPTMPSGYTKRRLLPIAVRVDGSGNIIPFMVASGWPQRPLILYTVATSDMPSSTAGPTNFMSSATDSAFATKSAASFIPPISRLGRFFFGGIYSSTNRTLYLRKTGATGNGYALRVNNSATPVSLVFDLETDGTQQVDFQGGSGSAGWADVMGFTVTEVL